jgi:hypothetical protein
MRKQIWKSLGAVACVLAIACNSGKAPAEAALKLAEEAVNSARTEAENLVPDDFRSLSDDLAAAKDAYAKKDYKGALAAAQSIQQKANDVTAKAKARKDELAASWNTVAADVPKAVEAVKSRVDMLSQSKKLPKGLDAAKFESAKNDLTAATSTWAEAQAAQAAGKWDEAIDKAKQAKDKAMAAMASLGMQAGA